MTDKVWFKPEQPLGQLATTANPRLVDIGARGKPLPFMKRVASHTHYVGCEADVDEASRLQEELTAYAEWRSVTIVPHAIANGEERTFFIAKRPGMSSLLEPDAAIYSRYFNRRAYRVLDRVAIPTITLDDAAERYKFEDASFLKLDTQGTELEILESGRRLLDERIVGVYIETAFHPFYRGQSLFSDIDAYLRGRGFTLFDLSRTHLRRVPSLGRRGVQVDAGEYYSRRPVVWAHCLYFKEPSGLAAGPSEMAAKAAGWLVLWAVVFEHFDFALEVLFSPAGQPLLEIYGRELPEQVESLACGLADRLRRNAQSEEEAAEVTDGAARDDR